MFSMKTTSSQTLLHGHLVQDPVNENREGKRLKLNQVYKEAFPYTYLQGLARGQLEACSFQRAFSNGNTVKPLFLAALIFHDFTIQA